MANKNIIVPKEQYQAIMARAKTGTTMNRIALGRFLCRKFGYTADKADKVSRAYHTYHLREEGAFDL